MRDLSIEEKSELFNKYNETDSRELKIGCLLLLGETKTAMELFNELEEDTKELFKSYPIWHFKKKE